MGSQGLDLRGGQGEGGGGQMGRMGHQFIGCQAGSGSRAGGVPRVHGVQGNRQNQCTEGRERVMEAPGRVARRGGCPHLKDLRPRNFWKRWRAGTVSGVSISSG